MTKESVIINNRPILYIAFTTLFAIFISSVAIVTNTLFVLPIILFIILALSVIIFSLISAKKIKLAILFIAIILTFGAICSNYLYNYNVYYKGEMVGFHHFEGIVYSIGDVYSDEDGNTFRKIVVDGETDKGKVKANVNIDANKEINVGNVIEFSGNFYKSSIFYDNKFVVYPLSNKVYYSVYNVKNLNIGFEIKGAFNKLKYKIYCGLKETMPKNYAIAYAMITGDDSYVSSNLIDSFRYSGIAHVFAVSGLHIGLIYSALLLLFKLFKIKGYKRLLITFPILLFYVVFCGFSPSCIRAFVIILVSCVASALYEKEDKLTSLALAFIVTLLINPFDLYTAGFILSFAVYFALVFLTKPIYKFLTIFCFDKVAKFLAPYLSAYLISLPLSIDFFGYSSIFSTLFNILLVPALGFAYILIFVLAIVLLIVPFYGVFAVIPNVIISLVTSFISIIDTELFLLQNISFDFSAIPYYILVVFNTNLINVSKKFKIIINLLLIITLILCLFIVNVLL